jgi:microcystin degradation protein MlrC
MSYKKLFASLPDRCYPRDYPQKFIRRIYCDELLIIMKRVLIAGMFHETHTFLPGQTGLDQFLISRGEELLAAIGDASPLAGTLETARDCGWEVVPAIDYRALPSPTVSDEVVEQWWREFESYATKALEKNLDGVFLVLHGAMASESLPDVEGELLRRIRGIEGLSTLPIGGVTDLHPKFSTAMAAYSTALVTYRKNPHTDAKETAVRAAQLFDGILENKTTPRTVFAHPPVMWPPTGTGTADEPMSTLENLAREIENANDDILAVNVHAGYSFADTPETGVSFSIVTTGDINAAQAELRKLCDHALQHKAVGNVLETPIESVMEEVKSLVAQGQTPIVLVEPSDNIGGGAPGDSTGVLRALLKHEIQNSAVVINDPQAVEEISKLEIGQTKTLSIGGKKNPFDAGPLELEVELVSTSDGNFDLEDLHSHLASMHGAHIKMGPCAVVKYRGITILLTTIKSAPMDLGQLRSQGIIPETLAVIGVKAAVAHRQAYNPISKASFTIGTPGLCSSDLKLFSYRHLQRPIYPLDKI